ncbi:cell division protein ZapE [Zavarzinia sp. CC-PAN008]|uniref:cell division protein ZapE n=1 Tax=Zavarzinia sp. CC-PAN008 TaxID=3243332 RepID=UPI003F749E35
MSGPIARRAALIAAGTLKDDPAQGHATQRLQALHDALLAWKRPKGLLARLGLAKAEPPPGGLYLWGGVGRGKSMLMDLFYDDAPIAPKRRVHFHAFMQEVHAAIHRWRQTPPDQRDGDDPIPPLAAKVAGEARLLCFDEFQVTDVADAMILGRLFSALFAAHVVVVATSNRAPTDLYQGGLNRPLFLPFIDLLQQTLEVVHLEGPVDHRLGRLKGQAVYFTGPNASARLDALVATLVDEAELEPETIEIQGRKLVVAAAKGVARASFADLCERPLGPADYLALAARFPALALHGVPRLGPEKRNEAKRLVTLIDALYEAHTRLLVSADAEPDALYADGHGAFEFQRTASRLNEMQSAVYLAAEHRGMGATPEARGGSLEALGETG